MDRISSVSKVKGACYRQDGRGLFPAETVFLLTHQSTQMYARLSYAVRIADAKQNGTCPRMIFWDWRVVASVHYRNNFFRSLFCEKMSNRLDVCLTLYTTAKLTHKGHSIWRQIHS